MIYNDLYNEINKNLEKKNSGGLTSISPPFLRLSEKYAGWTKGTLTTVTANSGVGKSKFTKFLSVTSVYDFIKTNPNVKAKIFYFALEEGKEMFWYGILSNLLYTKYNICLSPQQLLSLGSYVLDKDILRYIDILKYTIMDMEKYIEVIDDVFNPYGIFHRVNEYFLNTPTLGKFEEIMVEGKPCRGNFVYADEDQYVFVITDHISLLVPDMNSRILPQKNLHEAMDYFSKEFCLKLMAKRLKCVVINVQQQSASKEQQEFYKGQSIEKKLEPSLADLADNKIVARDTDMVIGLFAPDRYELPMYRGYDITRLKDRYRCAIVLKDRLYGIGNSYIHLYFNGATNVFKELPPKDKMTTEIYEKIMRDEF